MQDRADFLLELRAGLFGIEATDEGGAAIWGAHAFQDFDGGGLTGAIGTEQPENLSLLDGKAEATDGFDGAIAFEQALNGDDGFRHEKCPQCLWSYLLYHTRDFGATRRAGLRFALRDLARDFGDQA